MLRYGSPLLCTNKTGVLLPPVEDVPYLPGVSPESPCTPGAPFSHSHTRLISVRHSALFANSFLVCTDTFIFLFVTCFLASPSPSLHREFAISIKWSVGKPNKTLFMFERERKVVDSDPCGIVVEQATSSTLVHICCVEIVKQARQYIKAKVRHEMEA
ncbi:hypothetical protein CBL_10712 [Carabus blaptoides fortunei]